jgi:hypothetical protein
VLQGNYDVNVLMRALQTQGLVLSWFDRRQRQWKKQNSDPVMKLDDSLYCFRPVFVSAAITLATLRANEVIGYIVNLASESWGAFGAQHWSIRHSIPVLSAGIDLICSSISACRSLFLLVCLFPLLVAWSG